MWRGYLAWEKSGETANRNTIENRKAGTWAPEQIVPSARGAGGIGGIGDCGDGLEGEAYTAQPAMARLKGKTDSEE